MAFEHAKHGRPALGVVPALHGVDRAREQRPDRLVMEEALDVADLARRACGKRLTLSDYRDERRVCAFAYYRRLSKLFVVTDVTTR